MWSNIDSVHQRIFFEWLRRGIPKCYFVFTFQLHRASERAPPKNNYLRRRQGRLRKSMSIHVTYHYSNLLYFFVRLTIFHKIFFIFNLNVGNIVWYIVSLTTHCYRYEECYKNVSKTCTRLYLWIVIYLGIVKLVKSLMSPYDQGSFIRQLTRIVHSQSRWLSLSSAQYPQLALER